jgi:transcriptional regulator with XRE-family HTH domain
MNTPKSKHSSLSENLKALRIYSNVSQRMVAEYLNIERCTYTKWELGRTEPSFEMLEKIIEYFNQLDSCNIKVDFNLLLSESLANTDLSVYEQDT